jgi:hypothetical protein
MRSMAKEAEEMEKEMEEEDSNDAGNNNYDQYGPDL